MTILFALTIVSALSDPANYRFVERLDRYVAQVTRDRFKLGRLSREGNFVVTRDVPVDGFDSGPPFVVLPSGSLRPHQFYELRGQWLVLGWMDNGTFTADAPPQKLKFTEYKYTPWAVPIWNLPGYFEFAPPPKPPAVTSR